MTVSPTTLLVHGAFADSSSWRRVMAPLLDAGLETRATANPLRGVSADSDYVAHACRQIDGEVVLVGHSYGGIVISEAAATCPNVVALIYIAAFIPAVGENITDISAAHPTTAHPPELHTAPSPTEDPAIEGIELYVSTETYPTAFCADLPPEEARILARTQRPPSVSCFEQRTTRAAWQVLPSWAIVATSDQMIHPDAERSMARRAGSAVTELDASHAVALSRPSEVADVVRTAVESIAHVR